ncbi:unconventional myosin-Va [Copidosoma floridanum]|uniref:unconventional myosin-Va n=1 Tax=Copidosoma floridanum TaxID=29053 RepID=UPI000C6F45AF|nr:unconventional myosin-Va [Copidosoma floridanum]
MRLIRYGQKITNEMPLTLAKADAKVNWVLNSIGEGQLTPIYCMNMAHRGSTTPSILGKMPLHISIQQNRDKELSAGVNIPSFYIAGCPDFVPHVTSVRPWVPNKKRTNSTSASTASRGIISRAVSVDIRNQILEHSPKLSRATSESIFGCGGNQRIYLSPFLPPEVYKLWCMAVKASVVVGASLNNTSLWSRHERLVSQSAKIQEVSSFGSVPNELKQYLDQPLMGRESDPVQFWLSSRQFTPVLSEIALKYMTCQASSVSSERVASVGARVWTPNPQKVWEYAVLLEDYSSEKSTLQLRIEDGDEIRNIDIKSDSDLPPLRNPDILIGEKNLTSLSFLHEPGVLFNLQVRFQRHSIYTYCGIVLVAFNPYTELPIYGTDTIWAYRGQAMGDLEPHIFAVAEEAYTKLERESHDQSIIVSGESGAGKTVSAKYAMRYFATVGGSSKETQVEKKVLASSPIMEAIGNAKTTRNNNSSRFGKFIEIQFNKNYHIIGASMRTYLLEKSRVVFQANDERNYHIFYQMYAAAKRLPHLYLSDQEFYYLNQGGSLEIDGVSDLKCFDDTTSALTLLGFTSKQQDDMLRILAAILHLGNVNVLSSSNGKGSQDSDSCHISPTDRHLLIMTELLGLDLSAMRKWLCHRKIVSMREVILKPMSTEQAIGARDALAKHIYAEVFAWIVAHINASLQAPSNVQCFIGVLDIYGFETFDINSFEQFSINYANEKLQQQFNQHVFKLEQEEYLREEIEWTFIDFYDNQPCIDLIEAKLGILDLLDEECRMPKGSDSSWAEKLYAKCSKSKHFGKPRFRTSAFVIHHFADLVQYETTGFLEKNRDTVVEEQIEILKNSDNALLKQLFSNEDPKLSVPNVRVRILPQKPSAPTPMAKNKKTVGSQFRDSLNMLMATLNATTPHYVRCIKPNDSKKPFEYNPQRAVQQLRACGVLETIRISAAGFPSQRTYTDFFQRYRCLCKFKDIRRDDLRETCRRILGAYIKDADKFKFGKTKVLFRAGQVAYLEKLRADRQRNACLIIQKTARGFMAASRYRKILRAVLGLQRHVRGYLGRRKARAIRETRAATRIQAWVRRWMCRRRYLAIRKTTLALQTHARGMLARRKFRHMQDVAAAIKIQRYARGYLARQAYKRKLRDIVIVQSCVRKYLAKKVFRRLKAEARSVEHVKSLNKGLEMKIINLQHKINELAKENQHNKAIQLEMGEMKTKLESHKALEMEHKKLNGLLLEKDKELMALRKQVEDERKEKMELMEAKERKGTKRDAENRKLTEENERLRAELAILSEQMRSKERGAEDYVKSRLEREKDLLLLDQDQDRGAYQRLLKDYYELEQRSEMLEQKLARFAPGHARSLSNASSGSGQNNAVTELAQDHENIDFGYGSVRSTASSSTAYSRVETIDWNQQQQQQQQILEGQAKRSHSPSEVKVNGPSHAPVDVGLVLKLQQKLKDLVKENGRLIRMVEDLEREPFDDPHRTQDSFRLQEMEMENAQLKRDLGSLRKSVVEADSTTNAPKTLIEQFEALQEELQRRREECIQLHSVLADQMRRMKSAGTNYGHDVDIVNEDGELVLAFEAQKQINRQLEDELQRKDREWKSQREEWCAEIDRLQEEIQKQQKILSANLSKPSQSQSEIYMQYEIARLTSENLELQEKYDKLSEECRNFKKQIKSLQKRLLEAGLPESADSSSNFGIVSTTTHSSGESNNIMPVIRKKERDYEGMFEFKKEDINAIMRNLITELNPRTAITLLPSLPAYILFMCIRHTDFINDDEKFRALLTAYVNTTKRAVKRHDDFEWSALWLSNTLRLLHNMKQYSGDKPFQIENTLRQNEQCLRNFDLGEYRVILSNVALWIFNNIITHLKEQVQPLTVPALLEHEAIAGLDGHSKRSRRPSSQGHQQESDHTQKKLNKLLEELMAINKQLQYHVVDQDIIAQLFKQLFYFMCASALNNLLLRNEMCHWTKGMQIRYNLSHLEQWARDERLTIAIDALQPIVQAAQLLQARKQDEDVDSVCEMCDKLSANQIVKILNLYTPADEFETRVPVLFIQKVQAKLKERGENQEQLLMDLKFTYPIRFSFNPSKIRLEDIEVPQALNLPMLKKV